MFATRLIKQLGKAAFVSKTKPTLRSFDCTKYFAWSPTKSFCTKNSSSEFAKLQEKLSIKQENSSSSKSTTDSNEEPAAYQVKADGKKINVEVNGNSFSYEIDNEVKGGQYGTGGQYMMLFTCNHCEAKNSKKFNKKAYHDGVVLIRCDGCDKLHLIADNLGWFRDQKTNIETLAKESGTNFVKIEDHPELSELLGQQLKLSTEPRTSKDSNDTSNTDESVEKLKLN